MAELGAIQYPIDSGYVEREPLIGATSRKVASGSVWFKTISSLEGQVIWLATNTTGQNVLVLSVITTGAIRLVARNFVGVNILVATTDTDGYDDGAWHHVAFSFNLASGDQYCQIYVDGVDDLTAASTITDQDVDFDDASPAYHRIGSNADSSAQWEGCLTEMWGALEAIDLAEKIGNFYVNGRAADLGSDGSAPTGRQPEIYLRGPVSAWTTNLGTGGNFTEGGSGLTACSDGPLGVDPAPAGGGSGAKGSSSKGSSVGKSASQSSKARRGEQACRYPRKIVLEGLVYYVCSFEEEWKLFQGYMESRKQENTEEEQTNKTQSTTPKIRVVPKRVSPKVRVVPRRAG